MERRTPWGKLPACLVWLAIVGPLTCVLKTGLEALAIPGLSATIFGLQVVWLVAGGLSVIETVLVEGFRRSGNVWLLLAAVASAAGTLGAEYLNIENAARGHSADSAAAAAPVARCVERAELARAKLDAADGEVARLEAERPIWDQDGDATNDGWLPAAVHARDTARERLREAEEALAAAEKDRERARVAKNALADAPRWAVLAFLGLLKIGLVALAWTIGAPTPEARAGPPGKENGPAASLVQPASLPEKAEGANRPGRSKKKGSETTVPGGRAGSDPLVRLARRALQGTLNVI